MIAIIEENTVKNVIVATMAEARTAFPDAILKETDDAGIGWKLVGDVLVAPLPPPPVVPNHITMRQARLVLLGIGKLAVVDAAINSLPEPHKSGAKITWEYSTEVQRENGLVSQLGPSLGLTESQIDELFIAGAKL